MQYSHKEWHLPSQISSFNRFITLSPCKQSQALNTKVYMHTGLLYARVAIGLFQQLIFFIKVESQCRPYGHSLFVLWVQFLRSFIQICKMHIPAVIYDMHYDWWHECIIRTFVYKHYCEPADITFYSQMQCKCVCTKPWLTMGARQ